MANPQKENGFTSIANEILDEIPKRKLNGTQFRIIMAIWRYTYGFQRKSHDFSLNFLVELTGMSKDSIKKELRNLTKKKVLIVVQEATFNQPRQLAFNKNYDEWQVPKSDFSAQGDKDNTGVELSSSTGGQSSHPTGGELSSSTGGQLPPYIKKEKESIKEIERNKEKEEEAVPNPFKFFEENGFGIMPPVVSQDISYWLDSNYFDEPEAVVVEAMREAVLNDKRTWNYVSRILIDWSNHKIRTVEQVKIYLERWKNQKRDRPFKRRDDRKAPEPDWLHKDPNQPREERRDLKRERELEEFLNNL